MPYLDMRDPDNFTHLVQLFYAAHPQYRRDHEALRVQAEDPGGYWLSAPIMQAMARWARERHLITRQTAARLVDAAQVLAGHLDPAEQLTLTPRILGDPPRRQRTLLASELFHWLYGPSAVVESEAPDYALGLPAVRAILQRVSEDPEESPMAKHQARRLVAWLETQGE
jgi:hypothetical protein